MAHRERVEGEKGEHLARIVQARNCRAITQVGQRRGCENRVAPRAWCRQVDVRPGVVADRLKGVNCPSAKSTG